MGEHAKLSPSAFGRWSRCPGSVRLSEGLPDKTSAAAQWGTDAHQLLEDLLNSDFNFITLPDRREEFEDYEEKLAVATVAYNYACVLYATANTEGLNPQMLVEEKVYPEYYTGCKDLWGSADIIVVTDEWIEIIDLKAGQGLLVMPDSGQLKIYALGSMAVVAGPLKGELPQKEVRATIVQPRIPHPDGVIRTEKYVADELIDWCNGTLMPSILAAQSEDGELNPGESQCQFCKAKATCPALSAHAQSLAMSVFQDQTGKELADVVGASVDDLDLEKMIEINEAAPLITGWLKSIEAHIKDRLKNREPVPGYKLVRSGQRNKWAKPDDEVLTDLSKGKGRITKQMLIKETVISAPQALKLKDLSAIQRYRLQSYVLKSEGSLALVPASDGRPDAFPPVQFTDMSFLN